MERIKLLRWIVLTVAVAVGLWLGWQWWARAEQPAVQPEPLKIGPGGDYCDWASESLAAVLPDSPHARLTIEALRRRYRGQDMSVDSEQVASLIRHQYERWRDVNRGGPVDAASFAFTMEFLLASPLSEDAPGAEWQACRKQIAEAYAGLYERLVKKCGVPPEIGDAARDLIAMGNAELADALDSPFLTNRLRQLSADACRQMRQRIDAEITRHCKSLTQEMMANIAAWKERVAPNRRHPEQYGQDLLEAQQASLRSYLTFIYGVAYREWLTWQLNHRESHVFDTPPKGFSVHYTLGKGWTLLLQPREEADTAPRLLTPHTSH